MGVFSVLERSLHHLRARKADAVHLGDQITPVYSEKRTGVQSRSIIECIR